jgi:diguanylate cyclase (GGDEF)-like protein/putative nucleotidyltransferase with HDIG domain
MSNRAWAYIWMIMLGAVVLSVANLLAFMNKPTQWITFLLLTVLATCAQLYKIEAPRHVLFHATPIFLFAGVLLLDPTQLTLLIAISHGAEWIKERVLRSDHLRAWYLQPFNIAKNSLAGMAAHLVYTAFGERMSTLPTYSAALLVTLSATVYLVTNNLLLGQALVLARGVSWRTSRVFDAGNLVPEFVLLLLGGITALLWELNPAFVPLALSPLLLIYRALMVPQLKEEAQTDSKTGLFNARYLGKVLNDEMERARRFERPFTVIMADLDHLRNINNIYGHFAGDVVLAGIAEIIRAMLPGYAIAGRFGGEEFILGFPETDAIQAQLVAERIRSAIATAEFVVSTSPIPIKVTMSFGSACFPHDATTLEEVIHQADMAVYQAKHQGRNQLVHAADVPHYTKVEFSISNRKQNVPDKSGMPVDHTRSGVINENQDCNLSIIPLEQVCQNTATESKLKKKRAVETETHREPHQDSPEPSQHANTNRMSHWAWLYIWAIFVVGVGVSVFACATFTSVSVPWFPFVLLFVLATVAQISKVDGPNHLLFYATPVFFFAGVLLLPSFLLVLLIVGPHVVQWAKERWQNSPHLRDWYLQPFNVAMYLIAGCSAQWIYKTFIPGIPNPFTLIVILITLGAALAYIIVNNSILGCALYLARGISWQQSGVLKSQNLVPEFIMACLGVVVAWLWTTSPWLILLALSPLILMYRALMIPKLQAENMQRLQRVNQDLEAANSAIQQTNDELFLTLAKIFDARDPYVGGHAAQVAMYAEAIANELGLPAPHTDIIRQSAYLHDIGKMAIPETILHKPSKLTNQEFEIMKSHATIGSDFLETSQGLRHLAPFVRHHHERWDGRGYPSGLCGDDIPLESRILNVCDSVEAMASDRPYHKGMSVEAIIAEVRRCSGTQFDPAIANAFIRIAERNSASFVRNSAREVQRNFANAQDGPILSSAALFAKIYNQAT